MTAPAPIPMPPISDRGGVCWEDEYEPDEDERGHWHVPREEA